MFFWVLVFASLDLAEEVVLEVGVERVETGHQDEQDHSQGPYVRCLAIISISLGLIRAHVLGCAAFKLDSLLLSAISRKAQINDLDLSSAIGIINQNIFQLKVSMHNIIGMHIFYGAYDLPKNGGDQPLRNSYMSWILLPKMIEILAFAEFHDQVHMCTSVHYIVQVHDVWMAQRC